MRTIQAYKSKEKKKSSSDYLDYIIEYEKFMGDELSDKCQGVIKFIDNNIFKKSNYKQYSNEMKIFYIKMKADYNKYAAERELLKKKNLKEKPKNIMMKPKYLLKKFLLVAQLSLDYY